MKEKKQSFDFSKQPDLAAQLEYLGLVTDSPSFVEIPGTKRKVKFTGIKPYTMERFTELLLKREVASKKVADAGDIARDYAEEPYFAVKAACILSINSYWGLRLIYPLKWRIWAYLKGYTDDQMEPLITAGKKKLPLMAHWRIMASSQDMMTSLMNQTSKEAEQYRAELLSVANRLSSKTSPSTEGREGSSSDSLK